MNIEQIFDLAIKMGRETDPRDEKSIDKQLEKIKYNFEKLGKTEKDFYPKEKLENPYPDSMIHFGNKKQEIKRILVTVDATEAKILIAKELGIDLVICHHPLGKSLTLLGEAMKLQFYLYEKKGVPINIIEGVNRKTIEEVRRSVHSSNVYLTVDTAKLLKVNLMNIHTPSDNLVFDFLEEKIKKTEPEFVRDVLQMLYEIPEFQESARRGSQPRLFTGSPRNHCGKVIASEITGGTNVNSKIYPHLANAGIGTIISMHQPEAHIKEAGKSFINVVITPHIASDSLGMNLFIDELEKKGLKVIPSGGFIRVSRVKNPKGEIINPV